MKTESTRQVSTERTTKRRRSWQSQKRPKQQLTQSYFCCLLVARSFIQHITEYSPAFLFNSRDDNDCIPARVDVVSVGVITVGGGVAGDLANTHQETSSEKNKTEDN